MPILPLLPTMNVTPDPSDLLIVQDVDDGSEGTTKKATVATVVGETHFFAQGSPQISIPSFESNTVAELPAYADAVYDFTVQLATGAIDEGAFIAADLDEQLFFATQVTAPDIGVAGDVYTGTNLRQGVSVYRFSGVNPSANPVGVRISNFTANTVNVQPFYMEVHIRPLQP